MLLLHFLEKLEYFKFLATDQGQQCWQYAEDVETEDSTMPSSDFYLDRNISSLTALAPSLSVLFCVIMFSVKIISVLASRKMANACILQYKYKPCFELPENSVLRLHKVQYRNLHYGSERSQTYTCPTENPELGIF